MRLIDADAIKYHEYVKPMDNGMYVHGGIVDDREINAQPTIDAVPVIRCKDCERYEIAYLKKDGTDDRRYKPTWCSFWRVYMGENDFCSMGERKEE